MFYYPPYHATYWNSGKKKTKDKKNSGSSKTNNGGNGAKSKPTASSTSSVVGFPVDRAGSFSSSVAASAVGPQQPSEFHQQMPHTASLMSQRQFQQYQQQRKAAAQQQMLVRGMDSGGSSIDTPQSVSRCQSAASDFVYPGVRYGPSGRPMPLPQRHFLLSTGYAASYQESSPSGGSSDMASDDQRMYYYNTHGSAASIAMGGVPPPPAGPTSMPHQNLIPVIPHHHHHHQQRLQAPGSSLSGGSSQFSPAGSGVMGFNRSTLRTPLIYMDVRSDSQTSQSQASQDAGSSSTAQERSANSVTDQEESDITTGECDQRIPGQLENPSNARTEDEEDQSRRDSDQASVVRMEYEGIYSELRAACAGKAPGDRNLLSDRGDASSISRDTSPQPTRIPATLPVAVTGAASDMEDNTHVIIHNPGNGKSNQADIVSDCCSQRCREAADGDEGSVCNQSDCNNEPGIFMTADGSRRGVNGTVDRINGINEEFPPPPSQFDMVDEFECDGTCPEAMKEEDLVPGCPECEQFSTLKRFKQANQQQLQVDWISNREIEDNISTRLLPSTDAEMQVGPAMAGAVTRGSRKRVSRCQVRCLSCLAIVCGIVALGSLAMAVVSDQWVFTQEPITLPPPKPTGQRIVGTTIPSDGDNPDIQAKPNENSAGGDTDVDATGDQPPSKMNNMEDESPSEPSTSALKGSRRSASPIRTIETNIDDGDGTDNAQPGSEDDDVYGEDSDGAQLFGLSPDFADQALAQDKDSSSSEAAPTLIQTFKIGLWIVCPVPHANKSLNIPFVPCMTIDYSFSGDGNWTVGRLWTTTDFLARVLSRIRISTPFHLGSLFLMGTATLLGLIGFFMEDTKTLAACALYIMAGLGLGSGLIVYISVLSEEVTATADSKRPDTTYHFGWSFFLAVGAFALAELAALLYMVSYLKRFPNPDQMVHVIPGIERQMESAIKRRRQQQEQMTIESRRRSSGSSCCREVEQAHMAPLVVANTGDIDTDDGSPSAFRARGATLTSMSIRKRRKPPTVAMTAVMTRYQPPSVLTASTTTTTTATVDCSDPATTATTSTAVTAVTMATTSSGSDSGLGGGDHFVGNDFEIREGHLIIHQPQEGSNVGGGESSRNNQSSLTMPHQAPVVVKITPPGGAGMGPNDPNDRLNSSYVSQLAHGSTDKSQL